MWKHTCLQIMITERKGLSSLVIFYMVMRDSFVLGICEWYVYVEYADQNGNKTAKKTEFTCEMGGYTWQWHTCEYRFVTSFLTSDLISAQSRWSWPNVGTRTLRVTLLFLVKNLCARSTRRRGSCTRRRSAETSPGGRGLSAPR